ncbi:MAG: DNA translocase FtsK 4TM domain-containing protein, partial [Luteolibacter sp.]
MAVKNNRKRDEEPEPSRWSHEIIGIGLIALGLILFLSLVSYSPSDLPAWGFLEPFA